jgi:hypothetical protein
MNKQRKPRRGDQTFIVITRGDGTVTATIPAYWAMNVDGQLVKVTIPE